jgi:hypothetical protein
MKPSERCRFQKPHPAEWQRLANHSIVAVDDRNCLLFVRMLSDCFKPRSRLEAEIVVLRHAKRMLDPRKLC